MNLDTAWGIRAPTVARGRVITMDTRKKQFSKSGGLRGPEPVFKGTPMPGTLGMIVLKLLGD
jgi:hypothetical protein